MPPTTAVSSASTLHNLKPLFKTPHFYWFLGHTSAIFFFILYSITSFFVSTRTSTKLYNYCLNSIILTYLIVLRQSYYYKKSQILRNPKSLLRDDNLQYLMLLLVLRNCSKFPGIISSSLYPFVTFALFHSLGYCKSFIIPNLSFLPSSKKQEYVNLIHNFDTNYHEKSLYLASNFEFYLLLPVFFSFLKIFFLFEFLRLNPLRTFKKIAMNVSIICFVKLRYDQSKEMKAIVQSTDMRINQILYSNPMIPVQLQQIYQLVRATVIQYAGLIQLPKPQVELRKSE